MHILESTNACQETALNGQSPKWPKTTQCRTRQPGGQRNWEGGCVKPSRTKYQVKKLQEQICNTQTATPRATDRLREARRLGPKRTNFGRKGKSPRTSIHMKLVMFGNLDWVVSKLLPTLQFRLSPKISSYWFLNFWVTRRTLSKTFLASWLPCVCCSLHPFCCEICSIRGPNVKLEGNTYDDVIRWCKAVGESPFCSTLLCNCKFHNITDAHLGNHTRWPTAFSRKGFQRVLRATQKTKN